eukprot:GILK01006949.1.p1 GENE.GILK01006949.1~~GILK01006949.1.p1  ORF type:complete len:382 (+),score=55.16 GILK01006949.1:1-1146(+)
MTEKQRAEYMGGKDCSSAILQRSMATAPSVRCCPEVTLPQKMVSACAGALLTSLFVTPLDVVKTRLQSQLPQGLKLNRNVVRKYMCAELDIHRHVSEHVCVSNGRCEVFVPRGRTPYLHGTWDALVKLVRYEGLPTLWNGLRPTLIMAVPSNALYLVSYDGLKHRMDDMFVGGKMAGYSPLFAGSFARTFAATMVAPIELVRTRMQAQQRSSNGSLYRAFQHIVNEEGIKSLWKGLGPTLLRDVPFSAVYWMSYETVKQQYLNWNPNRTVWSTFHSSLVAGALSGSLAAVVTAPFDLVKTRQQIDASRISSEPLTTVSILRKVIREEGWGALGRGLTARIAKVAPACAIMVSSYEMGKSYFTTQPLSATTVPDIEDVVPAS